jgi:starvation-inducible DNA-binding protein
MKTKPPRAVHYPLSILHSPLFRVCFFSVIAREELTMATTTTKTATRPSSEATEVTSAHPTLTHGQKSIQPFGSVIPRPLGLDQKVCQASVSAMQTILADTITMRDLYKKSHWQVTGPHFYQLHLLFDKHFGEQVELVDELAERIQQLGGVSVAMGADAAEMTQIPRPPKDREMPAAQITRLLEAHEMILRSARAAAKKAAEMGDDGTNDLLVSDVIRTNEMQVWFLSEHLVQLPGHAPV